MNGQIQFIKLLKRQFETRIYSTFTQFNASIWKYWQRLIICFMTIKKAEIYISWRQQLNIVSEESIDLISCMCDFNKKNIRFLATFSLVSCLWVMPFLCSFFTEQRSFLSDYLNFYITILLSIGFHTLVYCITYWESIQKNKSRTKSFIETILRGFFITSRLLKYFV